MLNLDKQHRHSNFGHHEHICVPQHLYIKYVKKYNEVYFMILLFHQLLCTYTYLNFTVSILLLQSRTGLEYIYPVFLKSDCIQLAYWL